MSRKAKIIWAVRIYLIVQYSTAPNFRKKRGIAKRAGSTIKQLKFKIISGVFFGIRTSNLM